MRYEAVPYHRLKCLRVWRDPRLVDSRDDHDHVADLLCVPAVAANYAQNFHAASLGLADRHDQVGTDVLLEVSASNGEHQDRVLGLGVAGLEPFREDRVPTLVIGAGGQFRDIVSGCIGLDVAQLTKIVDSMAAIPCASANA